MRKEEAVSAYRLMIWQNGRLPGRFDTDTPCAAEAVRAVAARFPAAEGFRTGFQVAEGEQRILETGSGGIRILAARPLFRTLDAAPSGEA